MPSTYPAEPSPRGNANVRRVCGKCSGVFYIQHNADWYTCPHCGSPEYKR